MNPQPYDTDSSVATYYVVPTRPKMGPIEPTLEHGHFHDGEVSIPPGHTTENQEGGELQSAPLDGVELLSKSHRRLPGPDSRMLPG